MSGMETDTLSPALPPAWEEVEEALQQLDADVSAAEAHGALCGLLCGHGDDGRQHWLELIGVAAVDPADLLAGEALRLIESSGNLLRAQLADPSLGFLPLLPDDYAPLEDRVVALADWCRGFLLGLGHGGRHNPDRLGGDSGEIVRDFANMATLDDDYERSGNEEDERAFVEIIEYLRMGTLLINEELNPTRAAPHGAGKRLH